MNVCGYEYSADTHTLKINCLGCVYGASVEDFPLCMARTIDKLIELKHVETIVLSQTREFEYSYDETRMLVQIAQAIIDIVKRQKALSVSALGGPGCDPLIPAELAFLQKVVTFQLRQDPIGAYVEASREMRHVKEKMKSASKEECACHDKYLEVLNGILDTLESTDMIKRVKPKLVGYHIGDRALYRDLFHPTIRPNFMLTRYMAIPPHEGREIDRYKVGSTEVQIYRIPGQVQYYYHIIPPEFSLDEDEYAVLDAARRYMAAHRPSKTEFMQPGRMREVFFNIGRDMLSEVGDNMGIAINEKKLDLLAGILTRYTAGFGILEIILSDPNIQDIYINSPMGHIPIYLFHGTYEECISNIIPTTEDAEAWATRLRIQSGRPLDEANPVLDTEIDVPGARARVAAITHNLSPEGLAFSLRRHRDKPWTYPLLISGKMMNPLSAGLLSFMVDGSRTMLFAGTRSAGKTSVLGATLLELMRRYRIVSVEDTLELPIDQMRDLGYNCERLKSRSAITPIESEVSADDAIRTSLRLGDSVLVIGEVRSIEARALYEAMRVGALANLVAGTIHGDSPYGVFDRVVNDLGVPPTSFKATDIIVIANRLKSPDGLHTFRRITEITEVQKDWSEDPVKEKAFTPLMVYNAKTDTLEPTDTLINGESFILNEIANRVRDWRDNWDGVWDNIKLREQIKGKIVKTSESTGDPSILEAPFIVESNNQFHLISEQVREEQGNLDSARIYALWEDWLKQKVREKKTA